MNPDPLLQSSANHFQIYNQWKVLLGYTAQFRRTNLSPLHHISVLIAWSFLFSPSSSSFTIQSIPNVKKEKKKKAIFTCWICLFSLKYNPFLPPNNKWKRSFWLIKSQNSDFFSQNCRYKLKTQKSEFHYIHFNCELRDMKVFFSQLGVYVSQLFFFSQFWLVFLTIAFLYVTILILL